MKDIMSSRGGFSSRKISAINGNDDINSSIWNTERINKLYDDIENGLALKGLHNTPFKDNDQNLKRDNLPFEYTPEEWDELEKCKSDILYFAYNYCNIVTSNGIVKIKDAGGLRDYQEQILRSFDLNNYNILMASRQIGKSVTSAIFILWYLLFNAEKTALMVADNYTTTRELLEKFRILLDGLPFYMKPGIKTINTGTVKFDNDSRLVGRTTTKKSGIGLTVNLLYIDEFAHIDSKKLDEFYRAIFPTVTADPNSKIIITSTPNGRNKFYEIWSDAVNRISSFVPLRVDWWQVKGRGEEWKQKVISDLGSVEDFNQEYGLQFFSSDQLLLGSADLKKLFSINQEYVNTQLSVTEDWAHINDYFSVHPKYKDYTISDFRNDPSYFVMSIDTADGIGGDYSVLNIYKLVAMPVKELLKKKEAIRSELDTISIVQVGVFRTNELDINQFSAACEQIIYNIFNPNNCRIVLELNHKGEIVHNLLSDNSEYWVSQFVHSKHTAMAVNSKLGIKLGPTNKIKYCEKFKYLVTINKIIPNEYHTIAELMAFGKSNSGSYRGQSGNDDLAITSIILSSFFESNQFWDIGIATYESTSEEYQKEVYEKIFSIYRDNASKKLYNFDELKRLNSPKDGENGNYRIQKNVFDLKSYDHMKKIRNRFFKS